METVQVSFELPRDAFSALKQDPAGFVRAMRLAAAVKWYENGILSQGKAAEIAGLSRSEFVSALSQFDVTVFQYDSQEIISEVTHR